MDIFAEEVTTDEIITSHVNQAEKGFKTSVQLLADEINLGTLEQKIASFDIDGAVEEMQLSEMAFGPFEIALIAAWFAGLARTYQALRATKELRKILRAVPRQDNEMSAVYTDLVQGLVRDLASEQQGAARATILAGYSMQKRARDIARDLAGRYDPTVGRRVGGVIGLNNRQADLMAKIEIALRTNDKAVLRDYLKLKTRDQRFDSWVRSAIEGNSLSSKQITTILARLGDRNLYHRAKNIADDSIRGILARAQFEMINRQIRNSEVAANLITKVWHTMQDVHVRFSHTTLNGTEIPFGENYITGRGISMAHPHDPSAPISERAGCRCWQEYRLNGKRIGRSGYRGF